MGDVRDFLIKHFRHFNARETVAAAQAYEDLLNQGGKMFLAMAGAMSTGELGVILARMIREDKVHAISCTGANLEEDVYNLIAHNQYKVVPNWRALSAEMERDILSEGFNRVTDTCIPEDVMEAMEGRLMEHWLKACKEGYAKFPAEFLADVLRNGELEEHYQIDPKDSWFLAAIEKNIPVWAPGWEDSTTGQVFGSNVLAGKIPHHNCVKTGTEQFQKVMEWYLENTKWESAQPVPIGFFQIGGGIAGDFSICAVPSIVQDVGIKGVPLWSYFCQISDAVTSYGGYSGAVPNEKITWEKLHVDTPKFMVQSDASIIAPLIFAYLLND